jgi:hypothetical protein
MEGDVRRNLHQVLDSLPEGVRLVAVSKYHPAESIAEAYDEGQRVFGESHVQELQAKHAALPADIEWHFIGHLQTNKVMYIVPYVAMIDAVDSMRLLREIDRQAAKCDRVVNVLLELHIAEEEYEEFHDIACDDGDRPRMRCLHTADKEYDYGCSSKSACHDPHSLVLHERVNDIAEVVDRRGSDLAVAEHRLVLLHIGQILGNDDAETYSDR